MQFLTLPLMFYNRINKTVLGDLFGTQFFGLGKEQTALRWLLSFHLKQQQQIPKELIRTKTRVVLNWTISLCKSLGNILKLFPFSKCWCCKRACSLSRLASLFIDTVNASRVLPKGHPQTAVVLKVLPLNNTETFYCIFFLKEYLELFSLHVGGFLD